MWKTTTAPSKPSMKEELNVLISSFLETSVEQKDVNVEYNRCRDAFLSAKQKRKILRDAKKLKAVKLARELINSPTISDDELSKIITINIKELRKFQFV